MKTYSLSEAGYPKYRRRLLQRFGILALVAIAAMILVVRSQGPVNWLFVFPTVLLVLAAMGFSAYRSLKQQHEVWQSVRIVIGEDYVARQQLRIPEIRISRDEITVLREMDRGIGVHTADKLRSLVIPSELDPPDFAEIKNTLAAWMPIQPKSSSAQAKNTALTVVLIAGFGIIFFSTSTWLVLIAGAGTLGYYAYFFSLLQRDKGVDPKFRRNFLLSLAFLFFIFVMKLCVLFGWYGSLLKNSGP